MSTFSLSCTSLKLGRTSLGLGSRDCEGHRRRVKSLPWSGNQFKSVRPAGSGHWKARAVMVPKGPVSKTQKPLHCHQPPERLAQARMKATSSGQTSFLQFISKSSVVHFRCLGMNWSLQFSVLGCPVQHVALPEMNLQHKHFLLLLLLTQYFLFSQTLEMCA